MRALHCAGNGETKNGLGSVDAVSASQRETELCTNIPTPLHNLISDLGRQLRDWPPQNRDR